MLCGRVMNDPTGHQIEAFLGITGIKMIDPIRFPHVGFFKREDFILKNFVCKSVSPVFTNRIPKMRLAGTLRLVKVLIPPLKECFLGQANVTAARFDMDMAVNYPGWCH